MNKQRHLDIAALLKKVLVLLDDVVIILQEDLAK